MISRDRLGRQMNPGDVVLHSLTGNIFSVPSHLCLLDGKMLLAWSEVEWIGGLDCDLPLSMLSYEMKMEVLISHGGFHEAT